MNLLKDFITKKMKMSHIYQPVMLKTLLLNKGKATKTHIAKNILSYDFSQLEYYEKITNNMVGRILRKHHIVTKEKDTYTLNNFGQLSQDEVLELVKLCEDKIEGYIANRGKTIWEHRRKNRKAVPGSIRYQVLKRAHGRCELCGISKEEKALEVDHITPKNLGGEDSINNYQALCYSCNANKRDTDDEDFRTLAHKYNTKDKDCVFCQIDPKNFIAQNNLAGAFFDKYPVTPKHVLIIPKRHCATFFDLTQPEHNAINQLAQVLKTQLLEQDNAITGFNIGYNAGETAGQTIPHCHMHLIPRRLNDVKDPTGGIRHVIPGKGNYLV